MMFNSAATRRLSLCSFLLVFCIGLLLAGSRLGLAAEGGLTNYLPGYYGDYAVAVAPQSGLYLYSTAYSYSANTQGPKIPDSVALDGLLNLNGFQYVTSSKLFGAAVAFGGYTTFIKAELDATLPAPAGLRTIRDSAAGHGDSSFSPLILYWSHGNWHVTSYEAIIVPTGKYDASSPLNVSRNYFSFDTVLGITWLDPGKGLEISIVPGLMINTANPSTNYKTGSEFHLDGMLNIYLSDRFAIGMHGYLYSQVQPDSGRGAAIADLRSSSSAIGPSFLWIPKGLGIDGKIVGKWLHEVHAKNRFRGDIVSLTGVLRF